MVFSSFLILFKNSSRSSKEEISRLVFTFVAFVGSVATSDFVTTSGSAVLVLEFYLNFLLEIICF